MPDSIPISATAHVTLTKKDEHGNVIGVEKHEVKLTEEEARNIWLLQQQE